MVDNPNSYKNQDDGWGLTVQMFLCLNIYDLRCEPNNKETLLWKDPPICPCYDPHPVSLFLCQILRRMDLNKYHRTKQRKFFINLFSSKLFTKNFLPSISKVQR